MSHTAPFWWWLLFRVNISADGPERLGAYDIGALSEEQAVVHPMITLAGKGSVMLPRERGAVIVFSLSCLLSLLLSLGDPARTAMADLFLLLMLTSLHDEIQLGVVTAAAAATLTLVAGPLPGLWVSLIWLGIQFTHSRSSRKDMWWQELLGVAGVALAPLVFSCIFSGEVFLHFVAADALLASIFMSSALIRASRRDALVTPMPAMLLSFGLWLLLAYMEPPVAALSLIAYLAQTMWLVRVKRPSFKHLGLVQSACLFWVSLVFYLYSVHCIPQ